MKKISLALIILMIVGICIPAVSAEIIIDESLTDYSDTSLTPSKALTSNPSSYGDGKKPFKHLAFKNIEKQDTLGYVIIESTTRQLGYNSEEQLLPPGRYDITYNLDGVTKPGVIYISRSYDIIGNHLKSRLQIFLNEWDNTGLSGVEYVELSIIIDITNIAPQHRNSSSLYQPVTLVWYGYYSQYSPYGYYPVSIHTDYTVSMASATAWKTDITVDKIDDYPKGYEIFIARTIDDKPYQSTVKFYNNESVVFESSALGSSIHDWYPVGDITHIEITNPMSKTYTFTLTGLDDETPTDPDDPSETSGLTVYIKNSQTGALIANSNIVIDALVDGEYYQVVNRTEPSGIFTITLQPTGGGKPNPDSYRLIVTADGYNNPMPEINFTVDDYKQSIYCLLDPIAGGPVNENKTFIDFFVRDMSSNPISGATVKFGKYTLITNSAGYTVFEVDKNNNYTWTISKSGYGPLTGNAVIGDSPRHTINTVLAPIVTPTTTTPIPTSPPIGPTPTMTAPTGEHVSNWLEWFAAHFGMILGGGVEIGKIFMWLCFTVPVGVYVGKEAKAGAAGFMAGAGIVTLFFVLIGWVPIWLVVLLALIIGLLYAKVFNAQDNGGGR
jgi:hypothetical protein